MANDYQFPYSKIIRENGEIIPASDNNKKEKQLECLTDAVGNYQFSKGSIETRLGIIDNSFDDISNDITDIQNDIGLIDVRVTTLEGNPVINALDDIGDVEAPSPTVGNVLTYTGTGGWQDLPVAATLDELLDVDTTGALDGYTLGFSPGTGTGDGIWGPVDRRILVSSGLPGATETAEVFPVSEIRFISKSAEGEDHKIIEISDGVAWIGGGAPPGGLSILSGLTGLVTGRMSDDTSTVGTTYPPALAAGDIYDKLTQTSAWTFDTDPTEFGNASLGNLILAINGVDVANIDLAVNFVEGDREVGQDVAANFNTTGTGSPIAGGVVSFTGGTLTLQSVNPEGGIPVDSFQRGTAEVDLTSISQQRGYNSLALRHVSIFGTDTATLEWFVDEDPAGGGTDPTTASLDIVENTPVLTHLSGIPYYDSASTFDLAADGVRVFNNVYHSSEAPLVLAAAWIGSSPISILITDPSVSGVSTPPEIGETMSVAGFTFGIISPTEVSDATAAVTPRDPYGSYAAGTTPSKNFTIMTSGATSSDTSEFFTDEAYRLPNTTNFDVPIGGMPGSPALFDSTILLTAGARASELQVYDHTEASQKSRLQYPVFDFSNPATYLPAGGTDYSALPGGSRTYYRVFRSTIGDKTNGIITLPGITDADLAIIGLRIKVPSKTNWLDLTVAFSPISFPTNAPFPGPDGEGCRINAGVHSPNIDGSIEFSLGTIGTDLSGSDRQLILEIVYPSAAATEITGAGSGVSINW